MSQFHRDAATGDIHKLHQWVYADQATREAADDFVSSDVGKVALQEDTESYYILTNHDPITWQRMGSANLADVLPAITGTRAGPEAIVAGTGIEFEGSNQENVWFVQGSGGAVTVSANPQISAGNHTGQRLTVFGTSDTNTLTLSHGTGISMLDANVILANGDSIQFMWDGTAWAEIGRSS